MATSSSLIKTILHKTLAEGVYRDVVTKSSSYYYFLGKTLEWRDETAPPVPTDTYAYERLVRGDIITMKAINPSDVAFVIPRVNWTSGEVYDMYDDEYCDEILGLNIINGGTGFTSLPTLTITGGGGTGAKYYPIVENGSITGIEYDFAALVEAGITDSSRGYGYTSVPTVTITGGGGSGAVIEAVLNTPYSDAVRLEESNFYVMTDDYNVYKCLDNSNNSVSTEKPLGTSVAPIYTADGYVWKYMYNVPINLRQKFLSEDNMPVVSALSNQFYSNGTLDNIIVNNKGSGYTYANINVSSTDLGSRQSDPVFITQVIIDEGGEDYDSPTIIISEPVSSATLFLSEASVFLGQKLYNSTDDYYEVIKAGTLSAVEPSHRKGAVENGTAALNYVGTRAKGTVTVTDGVITGVVLNGGVREVNMTSSGSGYTSAPTVTFSGGGGSGVTAACKLNGDSVMYVTISNQGDDYTSEPDVVFGTEWTAATAVLVGEQYFYSNRLYTVIGAGTTHASTAPTHTVSSSVTAGSFVTGFEYTITSVGTTNWVSIGAESNTLGLKFTATGAGSGTGTATTTTATNGTAKLNYVGSPATGEAVLRYGAGYSTVPTVTIDDTAGSGASLVVRTSKSEAKLLPILDSGQLIGVIVEDAGIGYTTATIEVTGDGTGAELIADLNVGTIQSLQANNEILTTAGTINAIKMISGGYGYGVASVEIVGDGTGATASATINSASGQITKITIDNPGSGYTFADVVITGNGYAAKARAIMSPFGGHGKNAPDEFFARTLMFYSNVSTDLNQGVAINNDYRQLGIIKNPKQYSSNERFQGNIGSGCFIVSSTNINTVQFPRDTDVTVTRTVNGEEYHRLYRVVAASTTSALLQSLDNDVPQINDTFSNADNQTFSVESVGDPTVDKYSGQLMFIDNKAGFTPSSDETVTLRTIIRF